MSEAPADIGIEDVSDAIVIAGHSHTAALIGPTDAEGDFRLSPVRGHPRIFGLHGPSKDGFPVRSEAYWEALARCSWRNRIALIYGGNEPSFSFLFEDAVPFDFVPRGLQWLPVKPGAMIVPEALIRAELESALRAPLNAVLARLRSEARYPIALLGTPPPKSENSLLQRFLPAKFRDLKLTSPLVRLKTWWVLQEMFRQDANRHRVEFLPVPPEVVDTEGFLKPQFWADDLTHANPAYGQIILERLERWLCAGGEIEDGRIAPLQVRP